jgi:hypothetical protein
MTIDDVIAGVRALAAEFPECVYTSPDDLGCYFTLGRCSNGSVGCLIGQAVALQGGKLPDDEKVGSIEILALLHNNGIAGVPIRTLSWLVTVQGGQDSGKPWREAVAIADTEATL